MKKRRASLATPAFAVCFFMCALLSAQDALAGTAYTATITGSVTVDWNDPATWGGSGYPGSTADPTDTATVKFEGTGTPQLNLNGGSYAIDSLTITEGSGNADGNFINNHATTKASLTVGKIDYTTGGREIDFVGTGMGMDIGAATGQRLVLRSVANTLDFGQTSAGTDYGVRFVGDSGLRSEGGSYRYVSIRNIQNALSGLTGSVDLGEYGNEAAIAPYQYFRIMGPAGSQTISNDINLNDAHVYLMAYRESGSTRFMADFDGKVSVSDKTYYARFYGYNHSGFNLNGGLEFNYPSSGGTDYLYLYGSDGEWNLNSDFTQVPNRNLYVYNSNGVMNVADTVTFNRTNSRQVEFNGETTGTFVFTHANEWGDSTTPYRLRTGARLNIDYDMNGALPGAGVTYASHDPGGTLIDINAAQTGFPTMTIPAYSAIGGDLSTATIGTTLVLDTDAVLVADVASGTYGDNAQITGLALTRSGLNHGAGPARYWRAVVANSGTLAAVGDDGTEGEANIYKGWAFTAARPAGDFTGTLDSLVGQDLNLVVGSTVRMRSSTTLNSDTGVINIHGAGFLEFESSSGNTVKGTYDTINRYGVVGAEGNEILRLDNLNALRAGTTVNAENGRVYPTDATAVEDGAVVNVNNGATLYMGVKLTTGTININSGGALWLQYADRIEGLALGSGLNVVPGSMLILHGDMVVTSGTNLDQVMRTMNIVPSYYNADLFTGNGIVLGDGRYLMGPRSYDADLQSGSTGVFADAGASSVGMAAMPGRTLDINCLVDLAGVDLTVGSATSMTAVYGSTDHRRYDLSPTGRVNLDGTVTCRDLTLESGTLYLRGSSINVADVTVNAGNLYIGDGVGDVFKASGDLTVNGGWARLTSIAPAVAKVIDGNVAINDGGTFYCANVMNTTDALLDGLVASEISVNDGGQLRMEVNATANGGSGPFVVTQKITVTGDAANSPDDAQLWHDIQGSPSGSRQVHYADINLTGGAVLGVRESDGASRAALTLTGNATLTEDGSANDFDLTSVASSGGQYTLALGQTETFNSTLLGVVDADTTLDLTNASLTLGTGGQIDGSLIARSGSTFTVPGGMTTTIGGDLSVLAGSTVNFGGAYVTVAGLMSGDGVISGPVTVSGTGSVGPGTSPGTLTTGSLTLLDNSRLLYELDAPGTGGGNDLISVEGDLDVDDGQVIVDVTGLTEFAYGTYTLITYTGSIFGDAGNFSIGSFPPDFTLELIVNDTGGSGGTVQLSSVPEPSTVLLLLLGLGLLGYVRRGRRE